LTTLLTSSVVNGGLLGAATDTLQDVYAAATANFGALPANSAVTFSTFGGLLSGQFLVINDGTVGVSTSDALIRLSAVTGGITPGSFTTAI
jgi:hypothetical protein